jgi:3-hydroxybutyryl-CoA dehydrogenase
MDSPDEILGRMKTEMDTAKATRNADFVVEAVVENLDTKKEVFSILSKSTPKECIIASNTSSLPISALASATSKPDLVVGTHFWNPPHLVQAVEVVRGEKTSDETVERTVSMLKKIGKKPAVVQKDVPGQIGIRILYAMIREATSLVEKGVATPEDVDTIVREALGTRLEVVGPLELADLSGVDLVNAVAKTVYKTLDSSHGPQPLIQKMVQEGTLGIKSGKGFYDWKTHDPQDLIKKRDEHLIEILRERQRMV